MQCVFREESCVKYSAKGNVKSNLFLFIRGIMSTLIALNNSSSSLYKNSSSYVIIAYFIHLFIYLFIYLFKDFCLI